MARILSDDQIELARLWRGSGVKWSRIADRLNVDWKTVKRAIDPDFIAPSHSAAAAPIVSHQEPDIQGDIAFKKAMLKARRFGWERFTLGVETRPGTERPVFMPHRGLPLRNNASPAQQCADIGGHTGRFERKDGRE